MFSPKRVIGCRRLQKKYKKTGLSAIYSYKKKKRLED